MERSCTVGPYDRNTETLKHVIDTRRHDSTSGQLNSDELAGLELFGCLL
jgi:hypothetical protein